MAEELTRHGRLAAALIAGPAITVGMLGAGAAPAFAQDEAEAPEDAVTDEEVVEDDVEDVENDAGGSEDDTEDEGDEDADAADPANDGDADTDAEDVVTDEDDDEPETPQAASETLEDEDDEENAEEAEAEEVELLQDEAGEVEWTVEGSVVTGTGFPEEAGYISVEIESPSGATATRSVEDGVLTFDALELANQLELGFGPQTLGLSWSWSYYDDDFEEHSGEGSAEVTVTAVPPLQTGEDLTPEEIASALSGDSTSIDNVQTIGQDVQIGQFSGWDGLGIPAGIVLSTGNLLESWAAVTGRGYGSLSTNLEGEGDADLDGILEGTGPDHDPNPQTHDAAGLEFSFVPDEAYVQFSYVFASEEYPNTSTWNDIFAFLVNGENYAVFDSDSGETLPVSIRTINIEDNSHLYNDNAPGEDGERPYESDVRGFTTVLTFTAPVNPGEVNTLKLVIGDTNDGILDSLVFLQGGSFEQIQGPVTSGGEFTTEPGEPVSGEFELDTNIEDPEWTIDIVEGVSEEAGELEIDGTTWTFTPAEGFTGEASFTFTANDGQLTTVPSTISIQVGEPDEDDDEDDDDDVTDPGDDDTTDPGDDDGSTDPGDDDASDPGDDDGSTDPGDDDASEDESGIELTLDTNEVEAGDQVTVVGEGFEAGEDVEFALNPELGTFPADEDGVVTAVVTIPEDTEPGEYTITATGVSSGLSGSAALTVVEPTGAAPAGETGDGAPEAKGPGAGELAATGVTSGQAGLASGLLLLLGGGLAAVGYKNRLGRRQADA